MKKLLSPEKSEGLGLLLARVPLGVCFATVGTTVIARPGVAAFAARYASLLPSWVSRDAGRIMLSGLPFVAALAGAMIVVGVFTRINGFIASAILIGLTACATGFHDPGRSLPFHPSLLLLGISLLLMLVGGGAFSVDKAIFGKGGGAAPRD
jgi:uncharacterized membrane protein YphA (DoxX/SURF4 family)